MEKVKEPMALLTLSNSAGLLVMSYYFYKQNEDLKKELYNMKEEFNKYKREGNKELTDLKRSMESVKRSVSSLPDQEGLSDLHDRIKDIESTLESEDILIGESKRSPSPTKRKQLQSSKLKVQNRGRQQHKSPAKPFKSDYEDEDFDKLLKSPGVNKI